MQLKAYHYKVMRIIDGSMMFCCKSTYKIITIWLMINSVMVNAYGSNDAHQDTNCSPRGRFYVNLDMTGYFATDIYKNYNPDALWLRGYIALMPMYGNGKVSLGIGGALEKYYYQRKAFQSGSNYTTKSMGVGVNYTYTNNPRIKFQVSGRMYYHFMKIILAFDQPAILKDEAISYVVGWGPSFVYRRFQLAPMLNLQGITRNYFTNPDSDFKVESGILVNIIYKL